MITIRRIHLLIGVAAIIAFVLTGQYMDRVHGHLHDMAPAPRMLYRSTHIYLLFAGLLNCALGLAEPLNRERWRVSLATLGSLIIYATPVLFLICFFREPWLEDFDRPYSRPAIYGSLAGVIFQLAARISSTSQASKRFSACL
jgi:hypothetical protein